MCHFQCAQLCLQPSTYIGNVQIDWLNSNGNFLSRNIAHGHWSICDPQRRERIFLRVIGAVGLLAQPHLKGSNSAFDTPGLMIMHARARTRAIKYARNSGCKTRHHHRCHQLKRDAYLYTVCRWYMAHIWQHSTAHGMYLHGSLWVIYHSLALENGQ